MQSILRHRTKLTALILIVLVVAWAVYAYQDRGFWTDAAQIGMAEVALGNLALQKAQSERVRQFADQMVKDHPAVNDELKSAAAAKNGALPAEITAKQKAAYDKLNGLSGTDFKREFMKTMVKDHQAAVRIFEKQSRSDADVDAKAFAAKHLPTLQNHLKMAQTINNESKQNSKDSKTDGRSNRNSNSNSNSR